MESLHGYTAILWGDNMRKIIATSLIAVLLVMCVGCFDGYVMREKYPYYQSSYWYCEEIDFAFYYEYYENGRMKSLTYPLEWEGETLSVIVDFVIDNWYIDLDDGDNQTTVDEQLLSGTWLYEQGNLILKINEDHLFGGRYRELVFIPVS